MASPVHASVNPHFPSGRPQSGSFDDYTLETISNRGGRVTKSSSPRTSAVRTDKLRRKHHSQTPRGRRTPSTQQVNYDDSTGFSFSGDPSHYSSHRSPPTELKRTNSSPLVLPSPNAKTQGDVEMDLHEYLLLEGQKLTEKRWDMDKQLKTTPITHEQLVPEVRGIYRGLAMVEEKCIKLDKEQSESKEDLTPVQWQALISIHSTLLHEHHDFFLSSQHPAAQEELTDLAKKYSMPARMWRYGIHSLLELLRHKLPDSLEYMLHFIYIAYSMVTLLLENVSKFQETWIECLGDLARYRMAIEELDMRDREVWAAVSQYWYNKEADLSPDVGRVQHHLAVLARPDALAQLFYYTKALLCRNPFRNARESIELLFSSVYEQQRQDSMPAALIATHGTLFHQKPSAEFKMRANNYLSLLQKEIPQFDAQGQAGVFVMSSNFAAIFQYGEPEHELALEFSQTKSGPFIELYKLALEWQNPSPSDNQSSEKLQDPDELASKICSPVVFNGSALTFHSMAVFLDHSGDPRAHAGIHTGLSFIWSLAIHPLAMEKLEPMIPWLKIIRFLNSLLHHKTDFEKIEGLSHPRFTAENENRRARNTIKREMERREREKMNGAHSSEKLGEQLEPEIPDHLPEDFLIRGQVWSESYYPKGFFEGGPVEHDRSFIESEPLAPVRQHRCLWLGVRLSMVCGILLRNV